MISLIIFDALSVILGMRLSIIARITLLLACLFGILSSGTKSKDLLLFYCLFFFVFMQQCISLISIKSFSTITFIENIALILKYFSFPLILLWCKRLDIGKIEVLRKVVYISIILYCLSIVVSPILAVEGLRTYPEESGRFGFKGLISSGNETAMILLIACFWSGQIYLSKKRFLDLLVFFLTIISALMVGSKAGLLIAMGSLLGVFALNFKRLKLSHILILVSIFLIFIFQFGGWLWTYLYPAIELTYQYFSSRITDNSLSNYFSLMVSGRDVKMLEVIAQLGTYNYIHLLIGGWPVSNFMIEMDYFDLTLLFGIPIGTLMFSYYFYLIFKLLDATVMQSLFFLIMLATTFFAGHIIFSMLHSPLLAVYLLHSKERFSQRYVI